LLLTLKRLQGLEIARIIFVRHGHLPNHMSTALSGPIANLPAHVVKPWSRSGGRFSNIAKQIKNDVYGPESLIRAWVAGVVSHTDCEVKITNWDLAAKEFEFIPDGETDPAPRLAKRDLLRTSIEKLQDQVQAMYRAASAKARKESTGGTTKKKRARAKKLAAYYQQLASDDARIEPLHANTNFASAQEARDTRLISSLQAGRRGPEGVLARAS
jgi:hypothetical protein